MGGGAGRTAPASGKVGWEPVFQSPGKGQGFGVGFVGSLWRPFSEQGPCLAPNPGQPGWVQKCKDWTGPPRIPVCLKHPESAILRWLCPGPGMAAPSPAPRHLRGLSLHGRGSGPRKHGVLGCADCAFSGRSHRFLRTQGDRRTPRQLPPRLLCPRWV